MEKRFRADSQLKPWLDHLLALTLGKLLRSLYPFLSIENVLRCVPGAFYIPIAHRTVGLAPLRFTISL